MRRYVSAKLHNLRVTHASVDYIGSVTIDATLLTLVDLHAYEQVDVINLHTGHRWTTYVLPGPAGVFSLNGGGARLGVVGDPCVVLAYQDSDSFTGARVAFLDERNEPIDVSTYASA